MTRTLLLAVCVVALGTTIFAPPAVAQTGPAISDEPLNLVVTGGQPIDLFYPNKFDLTHPKDLILNITATELNGPGTAGTLFWFFDWIEPTGQTVTTQPKSLTLPGGASAPILDTLRIPFCPQEVSVHFHSDGTFGIQGKFTHICVPEPATIWLGLAGGVALVWAVRRRRAG